MSSTLTKPQLLQRLLDASSAGGYQTIVTARTHPFGLVLFKPEEPDGMKARVYIWNCTPGGKNRAADEYRVQLTGVVPQVTAGERTLLLGWHEEYSVFVAFDITKHAGQASSSPSIQVKENVLLAAHTKTFSAYERANGEIALAFRPEFFPEYVREAPRLHGQQGALGSFLAALNEISSLTDREVDAVPRAERREVIATIRRKVRELDFRARVLAAYGHQCAMCGVQLRLVEAAHIVPVAEAGSTDETNNGIALCSLHHSAYDRNLISFTERYRIEVRGASVDELRGAKLLGGLPSFKTALRRAILLPADTRDHPNPAYIRRSRDLRRWHP